MLLSAAPTPLSLATSLPRFAAVPVAGVPGLRVNAELVAAFPEIDTPDALNFVLGVYADVEADLRDVLALRAERLGRLGAMRGMDPMSD